MLAFTSMVVRARGEVAERAGGEDHTERVEDGEQVDALLRERAFDGSEVAEGRGDHAHEQTLSN